MKKFPNREEETISNIKDLIQLSDGISLRQLQVDKHLET